VKFLTLILLSYLKFNLWNGTEIFLKEEHSYPLVSFMTVVHSGSFYEAPQELGLTHFLEHMLFDGTKKFTREELRNQFSDNGIYVNAFTREDYTAFFFTGPSDQLEKGIYLLSEMLFESSFPEKEFEKEKGVVIQEMYMDRSREENIHHENAIKYLLSGLPYSNPVIGYEETIKNLKRESVIDFWKRHYTPLNMTIIAMGDFDTGKIMNLIKLYFGKYAPGEKRQEKEYSYFKYREKEIFKRTGDFTKNYLTIGFNAPLLKNKNSRYFLILQRVLNLDEIKEKIKNRFKGVEEISFEYNAKKGVSLFTSYFVYENDLTDRIFEQISGVIKDIIKNLKKDEFERAKNSLIYDKIYNEENYTYALIFKSYYIPFGGPPFEDVLFEKVRALTLKDFKRFFKEYSLNEKRGFASIKKSEKDTELKKVNYKIEKKRVKGAEVIFKYDPASPLLAIHVLAKNRNMMERKSGISEILSRVLSKNIPEIEKLGIRIKTYDNPYLPFDDYYHRKDFIYIRFEVPAENAIRGIEVLNRIINEITFDKEDVENAKTELLSLLKRQSKTPHYLSREILWQNLFEGTTYSKPLLGKEKDIKEISFEDIVQAHKNFFSPANPVIGIVSPYSLETTIEKLKFETTGTSQFPPETIGIKPRPFMKKKNLQTKQTYIRIARIIPPANTEDNSLLKIFSMVLSRKLQDIIREKMGLSYRLGAGVSDYPGFSVFAIGIGTSPGDWEKVLNKTFEIIEGIKKNPPEKEEINKILTSFWGRTLRYHQSRINQAYFMSLYEWIGAGYEYDMNLLEILRDVDYEKIPLIVDKYLKREDLSIAVSGNFKEGK